MDAIETLQHGPQTCEIHLQAPKQSSTLIESAKLRLFSFTSIPECFDWISRAISRTLTAAKPVTPLTDSDMTVIPGPSQIGPPMPVVPASFRYQNIFIAPEMPIHTDLVAVWENEIRDRLRVILLHEITRGTCVQEFLMAGGNAERLKPTIVITCGDKQTKKKVVKAFKSLGWLREIVRTNALSSVVVIEQVRLSAQGPCFTAEAIQHRASSTSVLIGISVGILLGVVIIMMRAVHVWYRRLVHMSRTPYPSRSTSRDGPIGYAFNEPPRAIVPSRRKARRRATQQKPRPCSIMNNPDLQEVGSHITPTYSCSSGEVEAVTSKPRCEVHYASNSPTMCGQLLYLPASGRMSSRYCSTGGLILIDGMVYILTAGHPFMPHASPHPGAHGNQIVGQDDANANEQSEDEPFWLEDDDSDIRRSGKSSSTSIDEEHSDSIVTSSHQREYEDNVEDPRTISLGWPRLSPVELVKESAALIGTDLITRSDSVSQSDWALISCPSMVRPNLAVHRDDGSSVPIVRLAVRSLQGNVSVICNGRPWSAVLRAATSIIQIGQVAYETQMFILDEILPAGCSGSWVVAGDTLCGHIIAVRQDSPLAYMMRADAIFEDIKRTLGTEDVRLPSMSDLRAQDMPHSAGKDDINPR